MGSEAVTYKVKLKLLSSWQKLTIVSIQIFLLSEAFVINPSKALSSHGGQSLLFGLQAAPQRQVWTTCCTTEETICAVKRYVRPGQTVAELGAQLRSVSETICESLHGSGTAVLVDVARKPPKNTAVPNRIRNMRVPGEEVGFFPTVAQFQEIAGLDDWKRAFLDAAKAYNVIVIDVNSIVGNDLEITSLSIAREVSSLFDCQTVIIKSVALNLLASRLVHGQRWIDAQKLAQTNDQDIDGTIQGTEGKVIATVGVQQYRETIPVTVLEGDAVLEVGCHFGTTTVLLERASGDTGYAIGVDVGPKIIEGAKKRYPTLSFSIGDAWKTAELLRIQNQVYKELGIATARSIGFNVIYVDVGGLSGSDGVLEALMLLSSLMNALEPRHIVIKSQCIRRLSSSLIPYWQIQKSDRKSLSK